MFSLIDCFTWNILYIVNITNYLSYDFITFFILNEQLFVLFLYTIYLYLTVITA